MAETTSLSPEKQIQTLLHQMRRSQLLRRCSTSQVSAFSQIPATGRSSPSMNQTLTDCSGRRTEHALFHRRKQDHFGRSEARDEDLGFVHWLVTTVADDNPALKETPGENSTDDDDALFLFRNHREFPSPAEELRFWVFWVCLQQLDGLCRRGSTEEARRGYQWRI